MRRRLLSPVTGRRAYHIIYRVNMRARTQSYRRKSINHSEFRVGFMYTIVSQMVFFFWLFTLILSPRTAHGRNGLRSNVSKINTRKKKN